MAEEVHALALPAQDDGTPARARGADGPGAVAGVPAAIVPVDTGRAVELMALLPDDLVRPGHPLRDLAATRRSARRVAGLLAARPAG
ncbi:hypothetical protein [Streptomyces sp. CBMA123]|uniref:hypothetical protein n=1 Tax=Streptomyces sp. CBMA123 TaxID=1896313 RepID=UPI001661B21D|nr:hypothetical protein [Streptomyces sp. CBMA123]MBD0689612.1 hypothetical protein [Streptomyces sp. CBMA123]